MPNAGSYEPDSAAFGKQNRGRVPFELDVSDDSKVYEPVSGEIVAQFDVRNTLILLDNPSGRA
jgi:hypothetical protein